MNKIITIITEDKRIWKLNKNIAQTSFISKTRQLFDTKEGCFIYKMDEEQLIKITFDKYIKLLLKLERLVNTFDINEIYNKK